MSIKTIEEANNPNLETICRLCLEPNTGKINISSSGKMSIPVRIMACAALEVHSSDGLPQLICEKCRFQLEKSYYFRKRCQISDAKLRKHIRLVNSGKKSLVFTKSKEGDDDDDEDENELQLKESFKFIAEEENKEQQLREEERAKWIAVQRELFRKEETKKLFEEFGNFVNSRNGSEAQKLEKPNMQISEVISLRQQPRVATVVTKSEQKPKYSKITLELEKDSLQNEDIEADNEITSSAQITNDLDHIFIYKDLEAQGKAGEPVPMYLMYAKDNEEDDGSQTLKIENEGLEELEEEMQRCEELEKDAELEMDLNDRDDDEDESQEYLFGINYEDSENDNTSSSSANVVESYQIEENGEVQYLKEEENTEYLTSNGDDGIINILTGPEYHIGKTVVMPISLPRKDSTSDGDEPRKTTIIQSIVNYSNISKDLRIFKCTECSQSFTRETLLARHRSAHKKGREYSCYKCDKWFSCKSSLDRHKRIHTGEKPFTCHVCGKSYMQKEVLKRHLAIHSGKRPHPCPHCPKAFVQKLMLTQHINAIHLEVPKIQKHYCHLCTKSFLHASGLSRHLVTHSGMRFRCSECSRAFSDKSSIRRHVLSVHAKKNGHAIIEATYDTTKKDLNETCTEYSM